jgi:hypothetical protein
VAAAGVKRAAEELQRIESLAPQGVAACDHYAPELLLQRPLNDQLTEGVRGTCTSFAHLILPIVTNARRALQPSDLTVHDQGVQMEVGMKRVLRAWVAVCMLVGACGDDDERSGLPYSPDETTLIGSRKGLVELQTFTTPDGDACINLDDVCVKPQSECGDDGAVDVLVDDQGSVVDVICYPTAGVEVRDVEGDLEQVGNDSVLVLDGEDDGVDIAGDVTIDGNNVTLYGQGPETSVIGGDLAIDKNNALVRGVRVEGDVTIDKNNPSIVDCVIAGDLTIRGNNVSVALCDVWGKLTIEGNDAVLVANHFATAPEILGNNTVCTGNIAFDDSDEDGVVDDDELLEPVACAAKAEVEK